MTMVKRFYETFVPQHYDLYIDVSRTTKEISGQATIIGQAKETTVLIHQNNLQIVSVTANREPVNFRVDMESDTLAIELAQTGDVELQIEYKTTLTDTMMGIYPSYYQVDGVDKQLVGTQFETNSARQAFPCVDEPEAKATFSLALKFDEQAGETALSNMPEVKVENGVHYFEKTVKMSTYLLAFAFGDLQSKKTTTASGVQVGVFATKAHQPEELDFAVDIAKRSIEFFEDYYQTPYPLPHSWQLALPDFSAGAMENWGLVTYREAYLLLDQNNSTLDNKISVATVIAHELAHQWFGDLVTMKWWDDLWLNESFANMMEYVAIDALEPTWKVWESFQSSGVNLALKRDAIDGVQPVHMPVEHPDEIDALFDSAIVYAKGARMLVMVRSLIGDQNLRAGLKNYFDKHKYSNATGKDLWQALAAASGMDVSAIMNTWLEQAGYPVINAQVVNGQLTLTQHQFFLDSGDDAGRLWQVPLNSNYDAVPAILSDKSINVGDYNEMRQAAGVPLQLNVGNDSHFIVNYDQELLGDLLSDVSKLDAITQFQILQDLHLLSESGNASYANLIELLPRFANHKDSLVIHELYNLANDLKKFTADDAAAKKDLQVLFDQLSSSRVEQLGLVPKESDTQSEQLIRPYVVQASLYAKNNRTMAAAHDLFEQYSDSPINLPADTRGLVLANEVCDYGNESLFEYLLNEYQQTADSSYKEDLLAAMTKSSDAKLLQKLVDNFKNSKVVKPQDLRGWMASVLKNPVGQQLAWDWFRNNWDWLVETIGGDMEFATYITVISRIFQTPQRLAEFDEFFDPKLDMPGLTREITMDHRIIASRVALIAKDQAAIIAEIKRAVQ